LKNIVFLNQKGGVGKTSLCLTWASKAFLDGQSVCVIDADPQQSAVGWKQAQGDKSKLSGMEVYSIDNSHDIEDLEGLNEDILFFDTAGNDTALTRAVLEASDLVIIPIKPSALDAKASINSYRKVQAAEKPCLYLINQSINNSRMTEETLKALRDAGVPHIENKIGNYTQFIRTMGVGETPISDNPYSPASIGMKKVIEEIEKFMKEEK